MTTQPIRQAITQRDHSSTAPVQANICCSSRSGDRVVSRTEQPVRRGPGRQGQTSSSPATTATG